MKLTAKKWLIAAGVLFVSGLIASLTGFAMMGFDFTKLNTAGKKEENMYTINESYNAVQIDTSTSDIIFETAKDGKARVEVTEAENVRHNVRVENGTLKISVNDDRPWYKKFFIFGIEADFKVVIYLPENMELSDIKINGSTGDVTMKNRNIDGDINIEISTGHVTLEDVKAKNLSIKCSTGDVIMDKTVVSGKLRIDSSTGDVKFTSGDAESIDIDTSTGDIYCTFLSEKNIKAETSTGKVSVPQGGSGGECRLDTSTGDITAKYE